MDYDVNNKKREYDYLHNPPDKCPACGKTIEEKCYFEWCIHPPHYKT